LPRWIRELCGESPAEYVEPPFAHVRLPAIEPEAVLVTDTMTWSQLDPAHEWVRVRSAKTCAIDHHVHGVPEVASLRCVEAAAAAVCEPVARLCAALLGVRSAGELPADVATPLYAGIATDTGWFKHSNVQPSVLRTAAELLDAGAQHVKLYSMIEQQDSPGRLRLLSKALSTLDLRLGGKVAMMHITQEDLRASGAVPGETGGLTDFTQGLAGVVVSAVFVETPGDGGGKPGVQKLSLRSKSAQAVGNLAVDVNAVAMQLGGGGHERAAGAKLALPLEQAKLRVEQLLAAVLT
jgi:phosphoesterase RecJ-like protein